MYTGSYVRGGCVAAVGVAFVVEVVTGGGEVRRVVVAVAVGTVCVVVTVGVVAAVVGAVTVGVVSVGAVDAVVSAG